MLGPVGGVEVGADVKVDIGVDEDAVLVVWAWDGAATA
jgi:hypothetical protein